MTASFAEGFPEGSTPGRAWRQRDSTPQAPRTAPGASTLRGMNARPPLLALVLLAMAAPAQAATVNVDAGDFFYKPYRVDVALGDTVNWRILPGAAHTITTRKAAPVQFDSGSKEPGETYPYTFSVGGRYSYFCTLHPGLMEGVVQVGPDTVDPRVTRLSVRRGTRSVRLRFRLSEEARVRVTIRREGRKVKTIRTKVLREGARSVLYRPDTLKPGSYRAAFVARDIRGNAASAVRKSFTVPEP